MEQHDHSHDLKQVNEKKALLIVLGMTSSFMVLEAISGFYTGSLALISDAGHMLTDVFALSIAFFALWFSMKPATLNKTFGFYRTEILGALINGMILMGISVAIIIKAYQRLQTPHEVKSFEMTMVAIAGLLINLGAAYILYKYQSTNLNIRGALYHVLSDALGSVGAITAGIIMITTKWYYADSIVSLIVAVLIIRGAWVLLRDSVHILLEGTPKGMDLNAIRNSICSHEGVISVHDLHAWTLTQGFEALSAHLVVDDMHRGEKLINEVKNSLSGKYNITHVTLQLETEECAAHNGTCYEDEENRILG